MATDAAPERLAKRIARAGLCSRRDAERLIAEGRVTVDGRAVTTPALNVTPENVVEVDGAPLAEPERSRLFRYHKPAGLVTAARDPQGRPTIYDRLPPGLPRLMPVGRLDLPSEGLLLLTNDGGLKRRLELPATGWLRRYRVRVFGAVDQARLAALKDGITVDAVAYGPILARVDSAQGANAWLTVGLREGRNREVRRVLEHLGLRVNRLIRIAYGPFQLGNLPRGAVDEISPKVLREQLGLAKPARERPAGRRPRSRCGAGLSRRHPADHARSGAMTDTAPLSAEAIDRAARTLLEARRAGALLPGLPEACRPRGLTDAYAVQDRLFALLGEPAAGWFLGCTNPAIQRQLGLPGPYRARLLAATVHDSPARLDPARFPSLTLEVEFAFRLGRDLPPKPEPYAEAEVAAAIAAVHPAIEVVTSHLDDWTRQPIWSLIADNGTDGALILGPGRADWRALDLPAVRATLEVNGEPVRTGLGSAVLGGPLAALTWLANDLARAGESLRAGQVVNTGTCTAMAPARPGDRAVARFDGLGAAEVRF